MKKDADLHRMVRKILWVKEGGRCVICGAPAIDAAHIFVRNRLNTAFDTQEDGNVHLLCRVCHNDDHRGNNVYRRWYIERFGAGRLEMLTQRANKMPEFPSIFKERRADGLAGELDGLRRGLYTDA